MTWLSRYNRYELRHLLYILNRSVQKPADLDAFMDELDDALHFWDTRLEEWDDPLLLRLAGLLNAPSPAGGWRLEDLSPEKRRELDEILAMLRDAVRSKLTHDSLGQILFAEVDYEQGNVDLQTLVNSIRAELRFLWDLIPTSLYYQIDDIADALELTLEMGAVHGFTRWDARGNLLLTASGRARVAQGISDLREAITVFADPESRQAPT